MQLNNSDTLVSLSGRRQKKKRRKVRVLYYLQQVPVPCPAPCPAPCPCPMSMSMSTSQRFKCSTLFRSNAPLPWGITITTPPFTTAFSSASKGANRLLTSYLEIKYNAIHR
ncbi:hypothetical protein ACLKA6_007037 [Drosophila palustris]